MPAEIITRLALLAEFASKAKLGRTAIMKLFFFLQESKGIDLGYRFSLYSYGPFDSDVLSDLTSAEKMNVLKSNMVYYSSGTGYEYSPGSDAHSVQALASDFLTKNRESIDWVLTTFGNKTAGQLELLSTLLFIAKFDNPTDVGALVEQVRFVKPHFSKEQIQQGFESLVSLQVLREQPVH